MALCEINFDGIVGPSHNYAGLSFGNLASSANAGRIAHPKAAALQGIGKMRAAIGLGLVQAVLLPHPRPNSAWLAGLGTSVPDAPPALRPAAFSASAMWAANAATVSPAPDTADGRCHLTIANLTTMAHRSQEWPATMKQLALACRDDRHFVVHPPVTATFGDEGAANHMRLCPDHSTPGVEIFVYGRRGGGFPARQHVEASRAVARRHGLDPDRTLFLAQSEEAIAAGAFHNDVVAVANEHVLFAHEQAFEERIAVHASLRRLLPDVEIIEVPARAVSLEDAISSYLFNGQLVSRERDGMALILPIEARETPAVRAWLETLTAGNGRIRELHFVDVRQSMANGGGPACLRLRIVADPATIDPRFLVDEGKLDDIAATVDRLWPELIAPDDLLDPTLPARLEQARQGLLETLALPELI